MKTIYRDKLVEMTDSGITFHGYYFPCGDRHVPFNQMERIDLLPPSLLNGSWRLWGGSDFITWFPLDMKRPKRDRIFLLSLRGSSRRIGFTVEDASKVEELLRERGILSR